MIKKYTRKPKNILAIQWLGSNPHKVYEFTNGKSKIIECTGGGELVIPSPIVGDMIVPAGDYIIKDEHGNISMMDRDDFKDEYEYHIVDVNKKD